MPKSKPALQSKKFSTGNGSEDLTPEHADNDYCDEIIEVGIVPKRDSGKIGPASPNGTKRTSAWDSTATLDPVFSPGSVTKLAIDRSSRIEEEEEKSRCSKGCSRGAVVGALLLLIVLSVLIGVFLSPISPIKPSSSVITEINDPNSTSDENIILDEDSITPNQDVEDNTPNPDVEDNTPNEDKPPTEAPTTASPTTSSPTTPSPTEDPNSAPTPTAPIPKEFEILTYTKIARMDLLESVPHDTKAFTQGLEVLSQDKIDIMKRQYPQAPVTPPVVPSFAIESTEMDDESTLRIVELETGNVVQESKLEDRSHSGGGCTYYYAPPSPANRGGNTVLRVVQLTIASGRGYVYDLTMPSTQNTVASPWSLTLVGDFDFSGGTIDDAGWGIVYHPPRDQFIVSDGSKFLHFWKLTETLSANSIIFDFTLMEKIAVKELRESSENFVPSASRGDWKGVPKVNELEWDPYSYGGNTILANVNKRDEILRIWVGLPVDGRGLDDDGGVRSTNNGNNIVGVRKLQNNQSQNDQSVKDKKDAGKVSHVYDLTELNELAQPSLQGAVLNGIAFVYDSPAEGSTTMNENEFWATGKYWSSMYRIRLIDE